MLKHEVMVADEWHNNGPQDLVTVSLFIQIAINKMQLCSLSVAPACPYHNHTATMGHSVHNVDISKHDAIHAVCHLPGTVEAGLHPRKAYFSSVPVKVSICPLKVDEHTEEFP